VRPLSGGAGWGAARVWDGGAEGGGHIFFELCDWISP